MASGADEKVESPAASLGGAPAGGGGKLVPILTIVNLLATMGMAAILFVSFKHDQAKPTVEDISARGSESEGGGKEGKGKEGAHEGKEGEKAPTKKLMDFGKMVTLDQFTVNLSTPGSVNPKFVRVNISLEVPNDDLEAEVNSKMPQVRNVIIDLFNSKRPNDLATPDGREFLKEEIRNALNGFMVSGKVKGVFFTNFALAG
ncbi:MAG: flagellar basal body-associated FliL family protein [Bdellovibrionota bacterium]